MGRCVKCGQWFYTDELQIDIGDHLPFMQNYKFTCKWCGESGVECYERVKAMKYQAIIDAFLNLMWERQCKEFRVAEIRLYIWQHWGSLFYGWPDRPERDTNIDIAPYFNRKP